MPLLAALLILGLIFLLAKNIQHEGFSYFATISFKRQTTATNLTQRIDVSADLETWFPASSYTASGSAQRARG